MNRTEFFDQVAQGDDPLRFTAREHAQMARLQSHLGDVTGQRVLEPGCGVGPLTEYLARWVGTSGQVFSFDSSSQMVRRCRERLQGVAQVQIEHTDIERFDAGAATWDVIILFRMFPHIEDKPAALECLRRCLAPQGRLVIANLEGAAHLNQFHAGLSGPVQHDHMPCQYSTARMLEACGLDCTIRIDEADFFYVEGRMA